MKKFLLLGGLIAIMAGGWISYRWDNLFNFWDVVKGKMEKPLHLPGKIIFDTDRELIELDGNWYGPTFLLQDGQMRALFAGGFARFTRDGKKLLYQKDGILHLYDFTTRQTQLLEWTKGFVGLFDLSPDGQWLAFTSNKVLHSKYPYPQSNLMVSKIDGTELRQLTDSAVGIGRPRWSPDGSFILFYWPYSREEDKGGELFVVHPDGTGLRQIVGGLTTDGVEGDWSPDGKQIVFSNTSVPVTQLYLVNADGSNLRPLTHSKFECRDPIFSPDGTQILFLSSRQNKEGIELAYNLFVINIDGTNERQVTPSQKIKKYGRWRWATDLNPDWAP